MMEISALHLCQETSCLCGLLAICAGAPLHRYNKIQISQHRLGLRGGFTSSSNSSSCLPCSLNLYEQPRLSETVKADSLLVRELQKVAKPEIPSSHLFTWTSSVFNFLKQLRPCKFNLQNLSPWIRFFSLTQAAPKQKMVKKDEEIAGGNYAEASWKCKEF
jgi:hypothetical protein